LTGAAVAQDAVPPPVAAPAQAPAFVTACPTLPVAPAMPDGATARDRDMAAGDQAMQAWNAEYVGIVNGCRQPEVLAAQAEMESQVAAARAAQARYQAAIAAYQADAAAATAIGAQWTAEVEEFNARGGRRN